MLRFDEIQAELTDLEQQAKQHSRDAVAFDQEPPNFNGLDQLAVRFGPHDVLGLLQ